MRNPSNHPISTGTAKNGGCAHSRRCTAQEAHLWEEHLGQCPSVAWNGMLCTSRHYPAHGTTPPVLNVNFTHRP
jgi:hypothetical protein